MFFNNQVMKLKYSLNEKVENCTVEMLLIIRLITIINNNNINDLYKSF